jgi:hypothetical protein
MMARAARSRRASSVARQISSGRCINNLQAKEKKIFEQSVALQNFHQPGVEECAGKNLRMHSISGCSAGQYHPQFWRLIS